MSVDAPVPGNRRRPWFLLAGLLILVAVISLVIAWVAKPNRVAARALFQVDSVGHSITGDRPNGPNNNLQYLDIFRKTHLALIKSYFVLEQAVRDPHIHQLSLFSGVADPVEWLQTNLEVSFLESSEILEIKLHGTEAQGPELVQIVNAIAETYTGEVNSNLKQQQLDQRDLMARSLDKLNDEIKRKHEQYLDIARATDSSEGKSGFQRQLDTKRLDRIDEELSQLERDQLRIETGGDAKDSKFIEKRIEQLQQRQEGLQKRIVAGDEKSVDLISRKNELVQLQGIANDLSVKLEKMNIDLAMPYRIRQIETATIRPSQTTGL